MDRMRTPSHESSSSVSPSGFMSDIRSRGMRKFSLALAATCAALATTSTALADESRGAIDWGRLLVQLDTFARTGAERPSPAAPRGERPVATSEPYEQNPGNAWMGVAPRVAFVARDWATAYRLAGDRLSLVDALRLSESTRMVVTRVRFGDLRFDRVTPFAQIGVGQWRTDTNLMPFTPRSTEIAGQAGGGIEIQISRWWQMAAESTVTAIVRDSREANSIPQTRLWSVMLASRIEF